MLKLNLEDSLKERFSELGICHFMGSTFGSRLWLLELLNTICQRRALIIIILQEIKLHSKSFLSIFLESTQECRDKVF